MLHSGYVSLLDHLRDSFDRPLAELKEPLRSRAVKALFPYRWDDLTSEQRQNLARQADYRADPANEAERQRGWDLGCEISEVEKQLRKLKDTDAKSVSEIAAKRQLVAELTDQLGELKRGRVRSLDEQRILLPASSTQQFTRPRQPSIAPKQGADENAAVNSQASTAGRTEYQQWLEECLYDGWFRRPDFQAFNKELIQFVCCYPDVDKAALFRNRERIEDAVVEVVCDDVLIDESDVPEHALDAFRSEYDEVIARMNAPLPEDIGVLNLAVWESSFSGKWRPDAAADGKQLLWEGFGYSCWIDAAGAASWQGPRFVPGQAYDGSFRGIEMSSRCSLKMVCAIAGFKNKETGIRLNPELFRALRDLGYGEEVALEVDQNKEKRASGNQKERSDEELLAILADSKKLQRAAQAKRLRVTDRGLRNILARAGAVAARANAVRQWTA